ncbi:alkylhydroperoxidase AhpD family core domain-containing protein [Paucidesulfovibrio gracilis DSM 16080]|uniref:Alkylhydroperoxidase AhpD family core domain-containing protein n=1 Tax=Paucidesulfovibrio gracilis DSM 16080 TaxID=1121449 RepID=A0A1T4WL78_9BACT|nr:carboxymuconolactone decarboxylase family protein [Paucidesulfovibrio gracilis]SKA78082.1 alkylhydroperoxidase AhpD family core domain-containing protein [Paucidesulfovibrio gracilis DSM 16080]
MQEPAEKATELFRLMNRHRRDVFKGYRDFTATIKKDSTIDSKTQSLILIACSILSQCDMCISLHVQNAASHGATRDEIIDAALLSVAMGGSPKMMYMKYVYDEVDKLFD